MNTIMALLLDPENLLILKGDLKGILKYRNKTIGIYKLSKKWKNRKNINLEWRKGFVVNLEIKALYRRLETLRKRGILDKGNNIPKKYAPQIRKIINFFSSEEMAPFLKYKKLEP